MDDETREKFRVLEERLERAEKKVEEQQATVDRFPGANTLQSREFALVERDPADANVADFGNRTIQPYLDEKNSKRGLLIRINGELHKLESTKVK